MLRKGQNGSFTKVITAEDIRNYADVVGDTNPIHINKEAALAKGFEKQLWSWLKKFCSLKKESINCRQMRKMRLGKK